MRNIGILLKVHPHKNFINNSRCEEIFRLRIACEGVPFLITQKVVQGGRGPDNASATTLEGQVLGGRLRLYVKGRAKTEQGHENADKKLHDDKN